MHAAPVLSFLDAALVVLAHKTSWWAIIRVHIHRDYVQWTMPLSTVYGSVQVFHFIQLDRGFWPACTMALFSCGTTACVLSLIDLMSMMVSECRVTGLSHASRELHVEEI